jgi:hypothetical protein
MTVGANSFSIFRHYTMEDELMYCEYCWDEDAPMATAEVTYKDLGFSYKWRVCPTCHDGLDLRFNLTSVVPIVDGELQYG